jgi:hypothetical protein
MRVRILGGGWYGCHIATALMSRGHEVELHDVASHLFAGASGGNPARLHLGFHYPRSRITRAMCQETHRAFMDRYGDLTRTVPLNVYAIAAGESLVDFGTYLQVLRGEVEFVQLERPTEIGLRHVEGAILTGERHIVIGAARQYFEAKLGEVCRFNVPPADPTEMFARGFDVTIDCTFCAREGANVERYEPCVTGLLEGPTDRAITIMDGPFPSLYPWDEAAGLSSLTSAKYTPLRRCSRWGEANDVLENVSATAVDLQVRSMFDQLCHFYPIARDLYRVVGAKLSIRAQPRSGADARFVDVVWTGPATLRVRAGKIDAILHAERLVEEALSCRC